MKETTFDRQFCKKLRQLLPGCLILKGQSAQLQGIPDRLVIWQDRWAFLEFKRSKTAVRQPNQEWYVGMLNDWSYASFVYPENEEQVLHEIQQAFGA